MKKLIVILVMLLSLVGNSQNEALFNRATTYYNEGEYEKASENYFEILENGEHSAALYYNIGNCYYKLNQIAPSIYYFEKALLLEPNDKEIKNNLAYAQNMTLDVFQPLPEKTLTKLYNNFIGLFSFDQWAYLAVLFICLFVIAYIIFYFVRYSSQKRIAFISSLVSLFIAVFCILMAFVQFKNFEADMPAIVFAEELRVKSEPNNRSSQAFLLHEGTKVNVLDTLDDWNKIELIDGQTGWVPSNEIKVLKDF
ncbi:tetratricopeptide repeat protein [uncultured Eudoraea sp.]|uniref:tetratricopeptide repeat protein n=1 Tax=uncultured Eudoraea sp. TaxID=1035614 RepID=UPI00260DDACC|nr:tetratricopeptide repeat protein [uncultured Eudoraea sp.]